jgi:hypothetical protein
MHQNSVLQTMRVSWEVCSSTKEVLKFQYMRPVAHIETLTLEKRINRWRFMLSKTMIAHTAGGMRNHGFAIPLTCELIRELLKFVRAF